MELIIFLLLGILSYMLYRGHREQKMVNQFSEIICRDYIVHIEIEKIGKQLFAYNKVSREFIAQANDFEGLKEKFSTRFPEKFGIFLDSKNVTIDVVGPRDAKEVFLSKNT